MGGYIIHFMVYTMAMSGLICFALFVYKKVMSGNLTQKGAKMLSIEETLSINPRKTLMIVKAGEERFLVASDVDKTTLISKLEDSPAKTSKVQRDYDNFEDLTKEVSRVMQVSETPAPVMQNIAPEPVHLEVISGKNPASAGLNRKSAYTSKNYSKHKAKSGLSTIRDMASKVNEL